MFWFFNRVQKGQRATAWISPGWSRTADWPLPPFVSPCPCRLLCDGRDTILKLPPYHYPWQNGLTRAEIWRCFGGAPTQMRKNVFWDSARIIRGQRRARLRMLGSWKTPGCVSEAPQSTQLCPHVCSRYSSTTTKCPRLLSPL